ncbi:hypothetical protein ACKWTF_012876 [Chironomus riparius]
MKLLIIFFALIVLSLCDEIQDRDSRGLFDCLLNCPKGKKPVRNTKFTPKGNGCGPKGFSVPAPKKFESCCKSHDICYGTCNSNKSKCDETFKSCMKKTCTKIDLVCNGLAQTFFLAVKSPVGCAIFNNVQGKACVCK